MRNILITAILCLVSQAFAADGTWITAGGGAWSTSGNWSGGTIADGPNATADFSTLNLTSGAKVLPRGEPGTCLRWVIMHANDGISGNFRSLNSKYGVAIEGNDLVLQRFPTGTCVMIR